MDVDCGVVIATLENVLATDLALGNATRAEIVNATELLKELLPLAPLLECIARLEATEEWYSMQLERGEGGQYVATAEHGCETAPRSYRDFLPDFSATWQEAVAALAAKLKEAG